MAKRGRFTVPTLEDISKEEEIHPLDRPLIFKNTANVEGVLEPNNLSDSGSKSQSKGDYPSLEGIHQRSHQGITDPQSSIDMKITSSGGSLRSQAITVHPVQRSNPVMKYIKNVPWEVDDIVPDFILGHTACAMFLR
jgi:hypothetical protein